VADLLKKEFEIEPELIKGSGGIFDVKVNGSLIYSKRKTGFFPTEDEIREKMKQFS
jgi:selenoprotein W-related protein